MKINQADLHHRDHIDRRSNCFLVAPHSKILLHGELIIPIEAIRIVHSPPLVKMRLISEMGRQTDRTEADRVHLVWHLFRAKNKWMTGYFRSCNEQSNRVPLTVPWSAPVRWLSWLAGCAKEQSAKVAAWQHTTIWNAKASPLWNIVALQMNDGWTLIATLYNCQLMIFSTPLKYRTSSSRKLGKMQQQQKSICTTKDFLKICLWISYWRSKWRAAADDILLPWAGRVKNCGLIRSPRFLSVQSHTRKMVRWFRGCSPEWRLSRPSSFC